MVPGTDNIADLIAAPGKVYEEGTFYNKANQLSDETAALLGGVETVNEAFAAVNNAMDAIRGGYAKIQTGSYAGTGTVGQGSKTRIDLEFNPELIVVMAEYTPFLTGGTVSSPFNWFILLKDIPQFQVTLSSRTSSSCQIVVTWEEKAVSWYADYSGATAQEQFNKASNTYFWIAFA